MSTKSLFHGFLLLSMLVSLTFTACSKDDDCKQETRCKIKSIEWANGIVDPNTGNITFLPYELVNTYDKNCNPIIRQVSTTEKDSCVYENGKLTEIHRLLGSLSTGKYDLQYTYFLKYNSGDKPAVIITGEDIYVGQIDDLSYENDRLVKLVHFISNDGTNDDISKRYEKNYSYHEDGNLKEINTNYFGNNGSEILFTEKEIFDLFVELKNPSYQSPFPDERNLSLCQNLYEKYEKYGATNTLDAFQYVDYSLTKTNDCGYQKYSYDDHEISYKCGCD